MALSRAVSLDKCRVRGFDKARAGAIVRTHPRVIEFYKSLGASELAPPIAAAAVRSAAASPAASASHQRGGGARASAAAGAGARDALRVERRMK